MKWTRIAVFAILQAQLPGTGNARILAINIGSALNSLLEFEELQTQHDQSNPCDS